MTAGARTGRFALLPAGTAPEARLLLGARALRAFGDGLISPLLPVHLARLGFGPAAIGALATATLAGSVALTLTVGLAAHRLPMGRTPLLGAAVLMVATGLAFPLPLCSAPARCGWPGEVIMGMRQFGRIVHRPQQGRQPDRRRCDRGEAPEGAKEMESLARREPA